MKRFFVFTIFLSFSVILLSQEFTVPENYTLDKAEDYEKYEKEVLACIDYLLQTPVNIQAEKRQQANAFLLKWLMGSPYVTIDIKPEIVTFMQPNAELMMIFMAGWAKYSIENDDDDKANGSLAGIESVIGFYTKNKEFLSKDKNVEKYIKMKSRGKLEDYIRENS